jgi:hypothetical protein
VIGLVVYFGYSRHHSRVQQNDRLVDSNSAD